MQLLVKLNNNKKKEVLLTTTMYPTNSTVKVLKWFSNKPYIGVVSSYSIITGWYTVKYANNDKEEMN